MKKVDLSVVFPAYNVEKYIINSVHSVLKQRGLNFEVIIVDDGSTDGTLNLVKSAFKDNSKVKIIHQNNKGSGEARNTGLKYALGKWIFFMDPDDIIANDMFEKIGVLLKSQSQEFDFMLFGSQTRNFHDDSIVNQKFNYNSPKLIKTDEIVEFINSFKERDTNLFYSVWTKIIKKEFIIKNNFLFTKHKTSQDAIFSIKLYDRANSILFVPEEFYYYFAKREGSAQTRNNPNKINNEIVVVNETRKMFINKGIKNDAFLSYFIMLVVKSEISQMNKENYSTFHKIFREKKSKEILKYVKFKKLTLRYKIFYFTSMNSFISYLLSGLIKN